MQRASSRLAVCDSELEAHRGYLRVDDDYVRVLTLKELPSETRPLLLNGLLRHPGQLPRRHASGIQSITRKLAKKSLRAAGITITPRPALSPISRTGRTTGPRDELVDDSKEAAVAELGEALTALGMEGKNFGEFTLSVVIYDEDRAKVEHAVAEFQKLFTQHDGLLYEERYNLLNAFFATVPGNKQFNLRKQWALNSNYADLSFLFTVDSGSTWNPHLEREYLAVLESTHGTPYYLNLHSRRCGAHAAARRNWQWQESSRMSFTLQSVQKYDPLTFIFDLGGSYEIADAGLRRDLSQCRTEEPRLHHQSVLAGADPREHEFSVPVSAGSDRGRWTL